MCTVELGQAEPKQAAASHIALVKGRHACILAQRSLLQFTAAVLNSIYMEPLAAASSTVSSTISSSANGSANGLSTAADVSADVSEGLLTFALGLASATQGVAGVLAWACHYVYFTFYSHFVFVSTYLACKQYNNWHSSVTDAHC
jgi:hypothetical protein